MIGAKRNRYYKAELMDRDVKLLKGLWRWKALSTYAIAAKYFANTKPIVAYNRLNELYANQLIKPVNFLDRRHAVWVLAEQGFKRIESILPHLASRGYKSEYVDHDYIATAFHLGEWLTNQPEYTQTFTEQELRRKLPDAWEAWVPKSDLHRPDGLSMHYKNGQEIIFAFEAELSMKAKDRYERIVRYYDSHPSIKWVFWLVDSKVTFNQLKQSFEKFHMREKDKHLFMLRSEFEKKGWHAEFFDGKYRGYTLTQFLPTEKDSKQVPDRFGGMAKLLVNSLKKPFYQPVTHSSKSKKSLTE